MPKSSSRRWYQPNRWEWLVIVIIIALALLVLESPSYYAEKGIPAGVHYGPITTRVLGRDH